MELKFRTLNADEIQVRVGQVAENKNGVYATFLLYKDARCDMALLDEVVGAMNWKKAYSRDNANCTVSIWDEDKKEWISKEDTGTESNTEKEKGLASDSFKRACVNWGIGRELYTAPNIRIKLEDKEYYVKNDRKVPTLNLKVSLIKYDANKNIIELCIVDDKETTRFSYTNKVKTLLETAKNEENSEDTTQPIEELEKEYDKLADAALKLNIDYIFNDKIRGWFNKQIGSEEIDKNLWTRDIFEKANNALKTLIERKQQNEQHSN